MLQKHLDETQLAALESGHADRETREHFRTCARCHLFLADARALRAALVASAKVGSAAGRHHESHPEPEVLAAYADGSLVGAEARSVEEHVDSCGSCSGDVVAMHQVPAELPQTKGPHGDTVRRLLDRLSSKRMWEVPKSLGRWLVALSGKGAAFAPHLPEVQAEALSYPASSLEPALDFNPAAARVPDVDLHHAAEEAAYTMRELAEMIRESADMVRESAERWNTGSDALQPHSPAEVRALLEIRTALQSETAELRARVRRLVSSFQSTHDALQAMVRERERRPAPSGPVLESDVGDLRLRIEGRNLNQPQVLTATVTTRYGQPVAGIEIETSSSERGTTVHTTNHAGEVVFELARGGSRLRVVRHGLWELELTQLR